MILSKEENAKLHRFIYTFPTERGNHGFKPYELETILKKYKNLYPKFSMEHYSSAMRGNTCMMHGGKLVMYHCDVFKAIQAGIENRELTVGEWD